MMCLYCVEFAIFRRKNCVGPLFDAIFPTQSSCFLVVFCCCMGLISGQNATSLMINPWIFGIFHFLLALDGMLAGWGMAWVNMILQCWKFSIGFSHFEICNYITQQKKFSPRCNRFCLIILSLCSSCTYVSLSLVVPQK